MQRAALGALIDAARPGAGHRAGDAQAVAVAWGGVVADQPRAQDVQARRRRAEDDLLVVGAGQAHRDLGAAAVIQPRVDVAGGVGEGHVDRDRRWRSQVEGEVVVITGARLQAGERARAEGRRRDQLVVVLEQIGTRRAEAQLERVVVAGDQIVGASEHHPGEVRAIGWGGDQDRLVVRSGERHRDLRAVTVVQPEVEVAKRVDEAHIHRDQLVVAGGEAVPVLV